MSVFAQLSSCSKIFAQTIFAGFMVFVFSQLVCIFFKRLQFLFLYMHGMETESVGHAISVSKVHCAIWVGSEAERVRCEGA